MIFDLSSQVWYFLKVHDLIITTENLKVAYSSVFLTIKVIFDAYFEMPKL